MFMVLMDRSLEVWGLEIITENVPNFVFLVPEFTPEFSSRIFCPHLFLGISAARRDSEPEMNSPRKFSLRAVSVRKYPKMVAPKLLNQDAACQDPGW